MAKQRTRQNVGSKAVLNWQTGGLVCRGDRERDGGIGNH